MAINLRPFDHRVLDVLTDCCNKPITQQHIADQVFYSRENVALILQRLAYFGVITRRRDPSRRGRPYIYQVQRDVFSNS